MYYKGQNLNLAYYVVARFNEWKGTDESWDEEGLVWAIQDYYGCMGEFSDEDVEFLKESGFSVEDFEEE